MTLTTLTISGRSYSSYATLDEALDYLTLEGSVWTKWNSINDEARSRHLATASRRLSRLTFVGRPVTEDQALAWPRLEVFYPDGTPVANDAVPDSVADVTILIAGDLALNRTVEQSVRRKLDLRVDREKDRTLTYFSRFFPDTLLVVNNRAALDLLVPWLEAKVAIGPKSFGTGEKSQFRDQYTRSEGFA